MHCTDRKKLMYGMHGGNYLTINRTFYNAIYEYDNYHQTFWHFITVKILLSDYVNIAQLKILYCSLLRLKEGGATVCSRLCKLTPCTTIDDCKGVNRHAPTGAIKTNRRDNVNHNRTFLLTAGQTRIKRKHLWRCNIVCFIFPYILAPSNIPIFPPSHLILFGYWTLQN